MRDLLANQSGRVTHNLGASWTIKILLKRSTPRVRTTIAGAFAPLGYRRLLAARTAPSGVTRPTLVAMLPAGRCNPVHRVDGVHQRPGRRLRPDRAAEKPATTGSYPRAYNGTNGCPR